MAETTPREDQNDASGGAAAGARRRKKGTGFPVVSLAEAAAILNEAGKYGFDHSTAAFASYMGHSTTNSGAFRQRLASFRDWKLIAGRGDSLSMTDVARIIALPPDEESERRALESAFMSSPVFSKLYEGSAKGQPLAQGHLGSRAVHDFGVSPGSKNKFVESFVESVVAAGLAEITDDDEVVLFPPGAQGQAEPASPEQPTDGPTVPPPRSARSQPSTPHGTPVVHQAWEIGGGSIIFEIRTDDPLPASAFVAVGEVVASLEQLAETLAPLAPTKSGDADAGAGVNG